MKSAREWCEELHNDPGMASDLERLIKSVQADAIQGVSLEVSHLGSGMQSEDYLMAIESAVAHMRRKADEISTA